MKSIFAITAALALAGLAFPIVTEWLRHRSWKQTRHTGYSPGTQHLVWIGCIGFLACELLAFLVLLIYR